MLYELPLAKCKNCDNVDEDEENMDEVRHDATMNAHSRTHKSIDWNTMLAYGGIGIGMLSLVLAVVTLGIMLIDRKSLKACLKGSSQNNLESLLL